MKYLAAVGLAFSALVVVPGTASAVPVVCNEPGDAGGFLASAASCLGTVDQIQGQFGGGNPHADMYQITIAPGGGFSATTVGGAVWDTQLFLFDAAGLGIAANDDSAAGQQSTLPLGNPLLASLPGGIYYLAISHFDNDPLSPGGLIFPIALATDVIGPTGPGGGLAINDWSSNADGGGQYTIFLTGTGEPIPEPGTLLLVGSGIAALALRCRRRYS